MQVIGNRIGANHVSHKFMIGVSVEFDREPRTVEIPQDLKSDLIEAAALQTFENSAVASVPIPVLLLLGTNLSL